MSIANRLSLFFLTALALVLVGFSLTLYLLASRHLHAQADDRLDAAMHTLVAAIEVHPGDVEWEPLERRVMMGEDPALGQVRWAVHDLQGRLVDCSLNLERPKGHEPPRRGRGWRVRAHRVRAGKFEPEPVEDRQEQIRGELSESFGRSQLPGSVTLPKDRTYHGDGLVLTVAVSEVPMRGTLDQLAWTMAGVSVAIWLSAAFWGQWLCRRALRPILQMAASAREIRQHPDAGAFLPVLPVPPTRDEFEELGRAFNDLLASLRESLERQQRFTGDASHQLRTPLTAMLGKIDVALRQERTPAEYQRTLQALRRRGDELHQIIESLLFLARADTASPLPDTIVFDLGEWCQSWLEHWADHPRAADFGIRVDCGGALVRTQPALLGQVLDNLLDNACKYSEAGAPIILTVKVGPGEAILTVADKGFGLQPDERALVFHPFYRAPHARWLGKPGVGLGLSVAQRLVAMMGGTLAVWSEPGQGSQFSVALPSPGEAEEGRRAPGDAKDALATQHGQVGAARPDISRSARPA